MLNKKQWVQWNSLIVIIISIVILNILGQRIFFRIDYTEDGKYSVSEVTKTILASIDDPVTIKIYYSENFPKQLITVKQYVLDMLDEYRAFAGNGLEYEFIMLNSETSEKMDDAHSYGVMPVQANITENDEIKVQKIYLGLVFLYEDKKEVLPFVSAIEQLEYDMTSAIKTLVQDEKPKIAWLSGHGEPSLSGDETLYKNLESLYKAYDIVDVNLSEVEKIDTQYKSAIMVQPTDSLSLLELYKLDQFMMRGGELGIFAGQQSVDLQNQYMPVMPIQTNLNDFLRHYGVEIGSKILMDKQSYQVTAYQNMGFMQIPVKVDYPYAPRLTEFDKEHLIVSRFDECGLFFPNEVVITSDFDSTNIRLSHLMRTSEKSGFAQQDPRSGMVSISVGTELPEFMFNEGSKSVAVALAGNFTSYFADGRPDGVTFPDEHNASSLLDSRMIIAGSGNFLTGQFSVPSAVLFFTNAVDWLEDENGLISIRSKSIQPSKLDETTISQRSTLKWLNILLAPAILIGIGVFRWFQRRKMKKAMEELS